MVDGDVYVSVMAFNLCQQWWPPICVNNNRLTKEILTMASLAYSAIDTQIIGEAIWERNLLKGPWAYGERVLGMGTINEGVS